MCIYQSTHVVKHLVEVSSPWASHTLCHCQVSLQICSPLANRMTFNDSAAIWFIAKGYFLMSNWTLWCNMSLINSIVSDEHVWIYNPSSCAWIMNYLSQVFASVYFSAVLYLTFVLISSWKWHHKVKVADMSQRCENWSCISYLLSWSQFPQNTTV